MKKYEKNTIVKFTLIYFLSTAFFVVILGHMASCAQSNLILQKHTIKMHQYLIKLKQNNFNYTQKYYHYKLGNNNKNSYELAKKDGKVYKKPFPYQMGKGAVTITVDAHIIDDELDYIKRNIIIVQICILFFFLILGYILAKMSLKPIQDNISHLDRFIKDLIHDLNTPISSILLNLKLLQNRLDKEDEKYKKPISRIEQSVSQITSLYDNLELTIQKELVKEYIDLYEILKLKKEEIAQNYPSINFNINTKDILISTHKASVIRILDNILTNSCKYASDIEPTIKINFHSNILTIKDNGKGMKYPKKIFERSYSESQNGHGIGMHIVHRLCQELDINIDVVSSTNKGTSIRLEFK